MTAPRAGDVVIHAGARWRVRSVSRFVTLARLRDGPVCAAAGDVRLVSADLLSE